MGKVYFLLLFFAVFGIFSGERGVNNRLRVRGADEGDYKDARNPLYRLGYFREYSCLLYTSDAADEGMAV